jgi:hypothetical protein
MMYEMNLQHLISVFNGHREHLKLSIETSFYGSPVVVLLPVSLEGVDSTRWLDEIS